MINNLDYKTFFDFSRNGQIITKNYEIVDCNKRIEELLEIERGNLIGKNIIEFLRPFDYTTEETISSLHKRFETIKAEGYGEFTKEMYDEHTKKIITKLRITCIKQNDEYFFYIELEDITDKLCEENVFYNLKSNFSSLYDKSVVAIAFLDIKGNIIDCNDYFKKMFNMKKSSSNFLETFDLKPKFLLDNGGFKKEVNLEEIRKQKNNKSRKAINYVEINLDLISQNNKIEGFFVQARDLSKAKEFEMRLKKQNRLMQSVINNIPKGIAVKDIKNDLKCVYYNKMARELVRIDKNVRLIGRKSEQIFEGEMAKIVADLDSYFLSCNDKDVLIKEICVDKGCTIKCTCIPVKNNKNEKLYFIYMLEDTTEFNKVKENEKQREKMAALGQLAGGVAHDFNNQLMSIIGNAMMIQKTEDIVKVREYAERIVHISQSSANLTRKILLFSRKNNSIEKSINMKTVLDNTLTIIKSILDKRITINYKYKANSIWVKGDESQIENVIINLAINSRDAIKNGGNIDISVVDCKCTRQKIMSHGEVLLPGEYIKLTIKDNGDGMGQETLSRIFEPYFSTKSKTKGTGLGLSVVFGTIKSHSGYINVKSKEDKGTAFEIYLPARDEEIKTKTKTISKNKKKGNRIILVDDDKNVLNIESELFEDLGYEVEKFSSPLKALKYYKKDWKEIDFVVLDMIMPEMSGRELYTKIKEINEKIKAIFISGFSLQDEKEKVLEEGAVAFIEKPFTFEEISSTLAKIY